mmetsp:Transcript_69310/g.62198  ORF Transcript_69310/g.62198 Transcript_69310/m.62198 type:complete len:82 (-) Transcript_69310:109-354(-)
MSTSGWIVWHQDGALHLKPTSNYWLDPGRSGQIPKGKSWETFDKNGNWKKYWRSHKKWLRLIDRHAQHMIRNRTGTLHCKP